VCSESQNTYPCIGAVQEGDPITANGFTERERYIAIARVQTNNTGVRNLYFKPRQVVEVFSISSSG